jgi:hypothetical protein
MELNKIKNIIKESLIKEVGDLRGVEFYEFEKPTGFSTSNAYTFNTPFGDVKVTFPRFYPNEWDSFKVNHNQFDYNKSIYDVGYSINGVSSQIEKTNYKELLKIVGTVSQIVGHFIEENNPYALLLFGIDKKGNFISDKQKNTLYLMLASKNKPPGYRISPATLKDKGVDLSGYVLFKN